MIAGGGEQLTLRAVARLADACNVGGDPEMVKHKLAMLRTHCDAAQRDFDTIETTHNNSWLLGRDEAAVAVKRERLAARGPLRGFVGTVSAAIDLIGQYQEAGVRLLINIVTGLPFGRLGRKRAARRSPQPTRLSFAFSEEV
jgi:alkanesulfonate monooxygenase SsuD/methylene tetrahydromethanopterin reductase-like flavin-dependent oxidoreductase (luciferase family)